VLISGFGRSGKAKGDIPGVRFKVVKVSGVGLLALWKEKKVCPFLTVESLANSSKFTGEASFINAAFCSALGDLALLFLCHYEMPNATFRFLDKEAWSTDV